MRYLWVLRAFVAVAFENAMAYRVDFWVSSLHALLNLGTGVLGLVVLFGQVSQIGGWDLASTLALLGVYMILSALRRLFIGPSLEALAGMDGEIWTGKFDFTLLRPLDAQFLASVRYWRPLALLDLGLGVGVLGAAMVMLRASLTVGRLIAFLVTVGAGVGVLYALLLAFSGLVLWRPGFLFTWVLDGLFQMARYPVGLYPGWLRLVLTWVIPVGIMTTIPAQALTADLPIGVLAGSVALSVGFCLGASVLFRAGLRRYVSASS
jgi:ABC-2 type transport system permease protein